MKKNTGFTLIELLIVALILGMIASVVVPQFNDSTDTARLNTARSTAANIQSAIEVYRAKIRSYPQGTGTVCSSATPKIGGTNVADTTTADATFLTAQLAFYSDDTGQICSSNASHPHGPFMKLENGNLPANPVNASNAVLFIAAANAGIGAAASRAETGGTEGWVYDPSVGEFAAMSQP